LPITDPEAVLSLPLAVALLAEEDHIREKRLDTVELPDNEEIELVLRRGAAISCIAFEEPSEWHCCCC
jgi:hypothetical protein